MAQIRKRMWREIHRVKLSRLRTKRFRGSLYAASCRQSGNIICNREGGRPLLPIIPMSFRGCWASLLSDTYFMGSSDLEKRLTGRPVRLPRVFTAFECGMNIGSLRRREPSILSPSHLRSCHCRLDAHSLWKGYYVLIMDSIARQIHPVEWKRVTFILFHQFRIASPWYADVRTSTMNVLSLVSQNIEKHSFLNIHSVQILEIIARAHTHIHIHRGALKTKTT